MPAKLLTMHRVVGDVEVEDQALLRRPSEGADELLDDLFLDGHRPLATGLLLEATQRRLAGQHAVGIDRGLQGGVMAQGVVVVKVLVAELSANWLETAVSSRKARSVKPCLPFR